MTYERAVATALARLRLVRRMPQRELAQKAGVSKQSISDLETGRRTRRMRLDQLFAILRALDVSLPDFLAEMRDVTRGAGEIPAPLGHGGRGHTLFRRGAAQ